MRADEDFPRDLVRNPPAGERPLRILQLNTTYGVGGITRHVLDLSAWLRDHGQVVRFAGTPGLWLSPETEPQFLALPTRKASGEGGSLALRSAHLLAASLQLRRWLKRSPVDLIHAHESVAALVARLATLGSRTPIALTYHGSEPERIGSYAAVAGRAADLVISVSQRSGDDLMHRGLEPGRLRVIGLGVRTAPAAAADRIAALRRSLLGPDGRILVVTVARICPQKDIDLLIEVVRQAASQRPDLRFVLVGDGPDEAAAKAAASAAGVDDRLHFAGRSDEAHLYLQAADLFLLTSRWEALPFTIVEAFQAGTPAIATDCGGVAELIDASVGRVAPVGDPRTLVAAVIELADDGGLRARLGQTALARSRQARFSPDHVHSALLATYRELVAQGSR